MPPARAARALVGETSLRREQQLRGARPGAFGVSRPRSVLAARGAQSAPLPGWSEAGIVSHAASAARAFAPTGSSPRGWRAASLGSAASRAFGSGNVGRDLARVRQRRARSSERGSRDQRGFLLVREGCRPRPTNPRRFIPVERRSSQLGKGCSPPATAVGVVLADLQATSVAASTLLKACG